MRLIYTFFIHCYSWAVALAALFDDKAKLWKNGRKNVFQFLSQQCENKQIIWFHCASLGEFEQGKPLIQKLKSQYPTHTFLVTFFSPSGYEVKKNDPDIDIIAYLPSDTLCHAKRFIQVVKPEVAFFVKYEYWYNYMEQLYRKSIPFYYISAIYRPSQYFFKPHGSWFARQLCKCSYFFVQNQTSFDLLHSIKINQVMITGDTRFDRVAAIAAQNQSLDFMESFKGNSKILVAGSSWQPDEQLLATVFTHVKSQYKLVIAPHLIDKEHINRIKTLFYNEKVVCYSERSEKQLADCNVLIIDSIGILSKIYRYAHIAYIGGAFATGLHNTLEAAVYGIPVFFGPKYQKFSEAVALVEQKGAFSITSPQEMTDRLMQFERNPASYQAACDICKSFVNSNLGAVEKIYTVIRLTRGLIAE